MDSQTVEQQYVREVYERIIGSSLIQKESSPTWKSGRPWPRVREFMGALPVGSLLVDVGCGPVKHHVKGSFTIGFDTCSEALLKSKRHNHQDQVLADGMHLPFRDGFADAVLCISVLHHVSSDARRRRMLEEISRIMAVGAPAPSRTMIYVWAFEQPNGRFPSKDVLVPINLHELPNGYPPLVRFHKESTREQRIIANSVPIDIAPECPPSSITQWISNALYRTGFHLIRMLSSSGVAPSNTPIPSAIPLSIPPAIPKFFRDKRLEGMTLLLSGINRWSPTLAERLRLAQDVVELYALELSLTIMDEALATALSTLHQVVFYRYYHLFEGGELEGLIGEISELHITSTLYDSANWCVIVEKQT